MNPVTYRQVESVLRQTDRILRSADDAALSVLERSLRAQLAELEARIRRLNLQALNPARLSDTTLREAAARGLVTQLEAALQALGAAATAQGFTDEARRAILTASEAGAETADRLLALYQRRRGLTDAAAEAGAQALERQAVNLEAVQAALTNLGERLGKHSRETIDAARESIVAGLVRGDGPRKMGADLRERTGMLLWQAERITRTETIGALDRSARERYARSGVEYVQRLAALDNRVCPYCLARHGNVYKRDEAPALLHPHDRCVNVPIRLDWLKAGLVDIEGLQESARTLQAKAEGPPNRGAAPFEKANKLEPPVPVWTLKTLAEAA